MLRAEGWETAVEVSFAIRGERGSVDVVGLRRDLGAILIVEVKTVIPDAGGMLQTLDRKARLAPEIAAQLGWPCRSVSRLIVVGDSTTTRRRVRLLAAPRFRRYSRFEAGPCGGGSMSHPGYWPGRCSCPSPREVALDSA